MHQRMTLLVVAACFTSATLHATDRLVAPGGGGGGVYPTITSAIAASSNGDRLVIAPATYNENITLDKNLTWVSNSPTQRYNVVGNMLLDLPVVAANATICSMHLTGTITSVLDNATSGSFRLIGSVVTGAVLVTGPLAFHCFLERDSLLATVRVQNGIVIGCHLTGTNAGSSWIYDMAVNVEGGSLRMIGNVIGRGATSTGNRVTIDARGPIEVSNNLFVTNTPTYTGPMVRLEVANTAPTATPCVFQNNTMIHTGTGNPAFLHVENTWTSLQFDVRNNFFVGSVQPVTSVNAAVVIAYNVASVVLAQVDQSTGAPSPGSPAINAGDPDASFTDLDLSRNDVGCYGGSYSRDNFDDPMPTSAVVLFLEAPRRAQVGEAFIMSGDAFDR